MTDSVGIGFCGLLTILFIGLKLTGYVTWSWIWIFAPIWVPMTLALLFLIGVVIKELRKITANPE